MKLINKILLFVILLTCNLSRVFAQTPTDSLPGDPGALSVYTIQNMSFGAIAHGNNGGTVTVATDGTRTATGDVVLLNLGTAYYNAIFEIESPSGTIITVVNGPDATLTGSNGGSMTLHIGSCDPASPFNNTVSPPSRTQINVGGTLTVNGSGSSPPGVYTGTVYITFNQQ